MSSESISLGQVAGTQAHQTVPVEAKRLNHSSEKVRTEVEKPSELKPAEVSEALADQAMEKVQKAQQETSDLSTEDLKEVLEEVNNLLYSMNRALRFEIHDKTEDLIVRVVNTKTDEVIRQYPREDVIERREKLLQGELGGFSTQVE